MSKKTQSRPDRERPEPPRTPFLCAGCRHGVMIVLRNPPRGEPGEICWQEDVDPWHHESRCANPRITNPVSPEVFYRPVVDCEGFEARPLVAPHAKQDDDPDEDDDDA